MVGKVLRWARALSMLKYLQYPSRSKLRGQIPLSFKMVYCGPRVLHLKYNY